MIEGGCPRFIARIGQAVARRIAMTYMMGMGLCSSLYDAGKTEFDYLGDLNENDFGN
jgi:hypothetical protein